MNLFDRFLEVLRALHQEEVQYILIGGFAVILHGSPRLTQDIDILIKLTPDNIDRLHKGLFKVFEDNDVQDITFSDLKKYAVVRYGSPDGFYIDFMARIGELAAYEDIEFETIEKEGVPIHLATVESLYKLKKDSIRPEDQRDLFYLETLLKNKRK